MPKPNAIDAAGLFDAVLEYVINLFTDSPKTSFSREDVLEVLGLVRSDMVLVELLRMASRKS